MKRGLLILAVSAALLIVIWAARRRGDAPEVSFTTVERKTLVSLITTNGRVEPADRHVVRAESAGAVVRLHVGLGQVVAAGAAVATIGAPEAEAELAAARAQLESAKAAVASLEQGGPARELAAIDGTLASLAVEEDAARREIAALERLLKQQAATKTELDGARDRLRRAEADRAAQQRRRVALVERGETAAAQARLREAEQAMALAERRASMRTLRAPAPGTIYELPVRVGDWLSPGSLVSRLGRLDPVDVLVYVDEPDLGRVRVGLEAALTWDALPGKVWSGRVERIPTQVAAMGSRQVGEVLVRAANTGLSLPPGANINAEIRAETVESALSVPKAALHRNGPAVGVYVLEAGILAWRPVRMGVSTVSDAQVVEGLSEGELVALPGSTPLVAGTAVKPVYR